MLSWMFQHDYLEPTVLCVFYACVLYFCICSCSAQLSKFHMVRHSRNMLIITTIIIIIAALHFIISAKVFIHNTIQHHWNMYIGSFTSENAFLYI